MGCAQSLCALLNVRSKGTPSLLGVQMASPLNRSRAKRKKLHCAKTRGNFSEPKRAKNKGLFYNASSICCFFESIQFKKRPSEDQVHKKCGCSLKKQKPEGSETSLGKNNLAFSPKNLAELALRGCCIATFKLNSKDCVAYGFKYRTFVYTANAKTPYFGWTKRSQSAIMK